MVCYPGRSLHRRPCVCIEPLKSHAQSVHSLQNVVRRSIENSPKPNHPCRRTSQIHETENVAAPYIGQRRPHQLCKAMLLGFNRSEVNWEAVGIV